MDIVGDSFADAGDGSMSGGSLSGAGSVGVDVLLMTSFLGVNIVGWFLLAS